MGQTYRFEVNKSLPFERLHSVALFFEHHAVLFQQDGNFSRITLSDDCGLQPLSNFETTVSCVSRPLETEERSATEPGVLIGFTDGTSFLTAGIDGLVKLWSSKGAFRSTLARLDKPVRDVSWAHDLFHIAFCSGSQIYVLDLRQQRKTRYSSPHSGEVLSLEWSPVELVLLSGAEDCRFCLSDSRGGRIYTSEDLPGSISALEWAPQGQFFCIATGETISLHSSTGESLTQIQLRGEFIQTIQYIAGMNRIGVVSIGKLMVLDLKSIIDENCISELYWDRLKNALSTKQANGDTTCNIVALSQGYGFLVAATASQAIVLPKKASSQLHLIDLEISPKIIIQAHKKFLLLFETGEFTVYQYNGLRECTLSHPDNISRYTNPRQISMTNEIVGIVDTTTSRRIVFYDIQTKHSQVSRDFGFKIVCLSLCQNEMQNNCLGVCINEKQELFVFNSFEANLLKIENFVSDAKWHDYEDSLVAIVNRNLVIWNLASYFTNNRCLIEGLKQTPVQALEEGTMIDYFQDSICILSSNKTGARHVGINPVPHFLDKLTQSGNWSQALKLCRKLEDITVWRFLGALASIRGNENLKKTAMSVIGEVEYLDSILED
eukprot:g328.t1